MATVAHKVKLLARALWGERPVDTAVQTGDGEFAAQPT